MFEVIPVRAAAQALIRAVESGEQLYEAHAGMQLAENTYTFPWMSYHSAVDQLLYSAAAEVEPDYERIEWRDVEDIANRPVRDTLLFLSMINHGERICDGLIAGMIDRGYVIAAANRIVATSELA